MEQTIVNEELLNEFERQSKDPVIELQFKSGIAYGTAFYFLKTRKPPKRQKTMKKIALGLGVGVGDLFKVARTAS